MPSSPDPCTINFHSKGSPGGAEQVTPTLMMPHSNGWLAEGVCGHFMGGSAHLEQAGLCCG